MLYHIFKYFTNCDLITYLRYPTCIYEISELEIEIKQKLTVGFRWRIYIWARKYYSGGHYKGRYKYFLAKGYSKKTNSDIIENTIKKFTE